MTAADAPTRTDLLTAVLAAAPSIERVQVTTVELAAGQAPGAHRHPCDVVGTVLDGSIRFQIEGEDVTTLQAGDAFFEPRDAHVLHFDNAADDEPARFLACYLLPPGQTDVITMDPVTS